jgi:rhomboid family protein
MFYKAGRRTSLFNINSPIKFLISLTVGFSLFTVLFDNLFTTFFGSYSPFVIFGLSLAGIKHFFYWQFITHHFIYPFQDGLSFSFLLYLAFNAYTLWFIGNAIVEKKGVKQFFTLYLLNALIAGVAAFTMQSILNSPLIFAGNSPAIYSLLIAWVMLNPFAHVRLFLLFPLGAKALIAGVIALSVLVDLSRGDFINFGADLASILFTYFYALLAWKAHGPFESLHGFERRMMNGFFKRREKDSLKGFYQTKIYDYKTGKAILGDEAFVDAALSKISQHGKKSLSFRERWRLSRISKRKKNKQ